MAGVTLEGAVNAAWAAYKKNVVSFVVAIILMMVIVGALVFIGLIPLIMYFGTLSTPAIGPAGMLSAPTVQWPSMLLTLLFSLIIITVACVVSCALRGGLTAMTVEALKKKQTSYETMFSAGFGRWKSYFGVSLLTAAVVLLTCVILLVPGALLLVAGSALAGVVALMLGIMLLLFAAVFFEVVFSYVYLPVAAEGLSAVNALKASYWFGRQNFWATLVLLLLFGAMSFAAVLLNLVTYILGSVIAYLVIVPFQLLSLAALYTGRKKGRR
jgi:hypothetical protein